ncbi:MAG: hypothetical protein GF329_19115 [Candidatus Lokiarchaeota archaeon]|nr:hypothetical protein [Candidatus Lokiarchaeota archaeon]
MSFDFRKIEQLLKDLASQTTGIQASALVSDLGLPIVSALPFKADEEIIAAMTAAIHNVSARSVVELKRGDLKQVLIEGEDGYLILKGAGQFVLSILADKSANLGMVFLVINKVATQIKNMK